MNPSKQTLSLAEKLDLLPAMILVMSAGFFSLFTAITRGEKGASTLALHITYAISRKLSSRLSVKQMQWIFPPTDQVYKKYAHSTKFTPRTVKLSHGGLGHWMGDIGAPNVLIWYHGGGFCLPANPNYFKFFTHLIESSKAANKNVAIFILTYTLAPIGKYPTQITQSVEALRFILTETSRRPSQILLGGDSAGGNLVFGVLSHLAHPHPSIAELKISEPLAGAVTIAPWTSLQDYPDYKPEVIGDLLNPAVAGPWASAYIGSAKRDFYTDPHMAPADWFATYPVNQILVTAGGNETLLPFIKTFVNNLRAGFTSVEFFIGKQECHVAPIFNLAVGDVETEQGKTLKQWLRHILQ